MRRSWLATLGMVAVGGCGPERGATPTDTSESASSEASSTGTAATTTATTSSDDVGTSGVDTTTSSATAGSEGTGGTGGAEPELGPCVAAPGDDVAGPPTLVAIERVGDRTLTLAFSEPIAPADAVDPTRFRLSVGTAYVGTRYGTYTQYVDPLLFLCSLTDGYCGEYVEVVEIGCLVEDPSVPALRIDQWSPLVCGVIDEVATYNETHLLLHYLAGDPPRIEDTGGEALASIAEHWVLTAEIGTQTDGEFPFMDPVVPIPCRWP